MRPRPALAQLFFASHLFYGVAAPPYRRTGPVIALTVGTIGITLSGAPTVGLALAIGSALYIAYERRLPRSPNAKTPTTTKTTAPATHEVPSSR